MISRFFIKCKSISILIKRVLQTCYHFNFKNESVTDLEFEELLAFLKKTPNILHDNWELDKLNNELIYSSKYFKLNRYETIIIGRYADFVATKLNGELRNPVKRKDEGYMLYEFLLNKSLNKIPSESNSTVYVMYQSDGADEELYEWYENKIGDTVQFPNFLSSSKKKWPDFGFYLQIKTCTISSGKYIGYLTNKEELEREVLFLSNTKFRIEKIDKKQQTIFLSELSIKYQGNYLLTDLYYKNIE